MDKLKLTFDILASLAALVAIVSVLYTWWQAARNPLQVRRVAFTRKLQGLTQDTGTPAPTWTAMVSVRNIRPFPVDIRRLDCYLRRSYRVTKAFGGRPDYFEGFSSGDQVLSASGPWTIAALGQDTVRIELYSLPFDSPQRLGFLLHTSHGVFESWITRRRAAIGPAITVRSIERDFSPRSRTAAKLVYWRLILRDYASRAMRIVTK